MEARRLYFGVGFAVRNSIAVVFFNPWIDLSDPDAS